MRRNRAIGTAGTAGRVLIGLLLVGSVLDGEVARGFHPAAWLLALAVFPAAALAAAWLRARRRPAGLRATGPAGHALRRDDQVGCVLFAPVDAIERGGRDSGSPAARRCGLPVREAAPSRSPDGGS